MGLVGALKARLLKQQADRDRAEHEAREAQLAESDGEPARTEADAVNEAFSRTRGS